MPTKIIQKERKRTKNRNKNRKRDKAIEIVLGDLGHKGKGYRALSNLSEHGGQEVPHLHFHLFGGEIVGKMVQ